LDFRGITFFLPIDGGTLILLKLGWGQGLLDGLQALPVMTEVIPRSWGSTRQPPDLGFNGILLLMSNHGAQGNPAWQQLKGFILILPSPIVAKPGFDFL